jgi:hypothetical protein
MVGAKASRFPCPRFSNPGSSASMRARISGLPQREHGGRRFSTNLYLGGYAMVMKSPGALIGQLASNSAEKKKSPALGRADHQYISSKSIGQ